MLRHLLRDKAALLLQYSVNGLLPLLMVPYPRHHRAGSSGGLAVALSSAGFPHRRARCSRLSRW
jgi:hypothetical protein